VGLWHTHPKNRPSPSGRDQKTTWEYLDAFQVDRSRYLMVIIGNRGSVSRMAVWVASGHSSREWIQLNEAATSTLVLTPKANSDRGPVERE
jgi:hypothetical protein